MKPQYLAVPALFALATLAVAMPSHDADMHDGEGMMMHHSEMMYRHLDELNLTADQKAKVADIRKKSDEDLAKKRDDLKTAHTNFMNAVKSADSSNSDLKKAFDDMQSKEKDLESARFDHMLEVRDVLTPDQRKTASAKVAASMAREDRGMHGKWHGKKSANGSAETTAPAKDTGGTATSTQ